MKSTASRLAVALAKKGLNTSRVSQSSLIFAQPIVAGNSTYTFPVLQNQPPVLPNEVRLSLQDLFEVTTITVGFSGTVTSGGTTIRRNFSAPLVTASEVFLPLYGLYQGTLKCTINEVAYLVNWDLNRHLAEGTSQANPFSAGVPVTFTENEGNKTGFFPVNPGILLNGQAKNEFTVQMPSGVLAPIPATNFKVATGNNISIAIDQILIIARGNLAQNASGAN